MIAFILVLLGCIICSILVGVFLSSDEFKEDNIYIFVSAFLASFFTAVVIMLYNILPTKISTKQKPKVNYTITEIFEDGIIKRDTTYTYIFK